MTLPPTPPDAPTISVVLGAFDRLPFLKLTIESIRRDLATIPGGGEIIVVDGGSTDGSLAWLAKQKDVMTIIQHNRGDWRGQPIRRRSWGYFMNLGFKAAQGRYLCMLSDDCLVIPGALAKGVTAFDQRRAAGEKIGAMAFYWRNWPDQKQYYVGFTLGRKMFVNHGLYLREAMQEVGFCDEVNYMFYYGDGDLCLRMWDAGWQTVDCPDAYIEHYAHANFALRQSNSQGQDRYWDYYTSRWAHLIDKNDPDWRGGWIARDYRDLTQTWRAFVPLHLRSFITRNSWRVYFRLKREWAAYQARRVSAASSSQTGDRP